ncbi:MAG: molybdopterin molybdotransferase MoeA [Dehalococcoidales bacterium]|nr:molybdopterin molybdotransferase MoeA [Dehalococcoidales bacterium]
MLSVEEALVRVLADLAPLPREDRDLLAALGQVLVADVVAGIDLPPYDHSTMDGYAVRAADTRNAGEANPVTLRVLATAPAGHTTAESVTAGTAIRIMTGAPLPSSADAVVPLEHTTAEVTNGGRTVGIRQPVGPRANVRRAGQDTRTGDVVLRQGTVVGPAAVAMAASLGHRTLPVHRRPRVAILATGDELVAPGEPLGPGQIYSGNAYYLAAQVLRRGGVPQLLGIAKDQAADLRAKIREASGADLLITSGGVAGGDFDLVKDVLAAEGEIAFREVAMWPGKRLVFGRIGSLPHLGLPGGPGAAATSFEVFAVPAIARMLGLRNWQRPTVEATILDAAKNRGGLRTFLAVSVERRDGGYVARLSGTRRPGSLPWLTPANGLAVIPEDVPQVEPGDRVQVMLLAWPEGPPC